ncbi:response regulator [Pseudomonas siliginis]|uniref:response regulator n=1 Tax=Pseudomonas siliginis TaxID=2842346 RepID=UPI000A763783|nr:response regulator [Pseudomonas koreensis]MBB4059116.1 CheY-like chemotaxis protein [Pseudomonas koreensis]
MLLVEDEGAIAMLIEEMLEDLGCTVVASEAQLAKALHVANVVDVDLAILDVNLAGERVFPVAQILRARNIPFYSVPATAPAACWESLPTVQSCTSRFRKPIFG